MLKNLLRQGLLKGTLSFLAKRYINPVSKRKPMTVRRGNEQFYKGNTMNIKKKSKESFLLSSQIKPAVLHQETELNLINISQQKGPEDEKGKELKYDFKNKEDEIREILIRMYIKDNKKTTTKHEEELKELAKIIIEKREKEHKDLIRESLLKIEVKSIENPNILIQILAISHILDIIDINILNIILEKHISITLDYIVYCLICIKYINNINKLLYEFESDIVRLLGINSFDQFIIFNIINAYIKSRNGSIEFYKFIEVIIIDNINTQNNLFISKLLLLISECNYYEFLDLFLVSIQILNKRLSNKNSKYYPNVNEMKNYINAYYNKKNILQGIDKDFLIKADNYLIKNMIKEGYEDKLAELNK